MVLLLFSLLIGVASGLEPPVLNRYAGDAQQSQIVFVLDASLPSRELRTSRGAMAEIVEALPDGDRVAVLSIADELEVVSDYVELSEETRRDLQRTVQYGRLKGRHHAELLTSMNKVAELVSQPADPPQFQAVFIASNLCPAPQEGEEGPCGVPPDLTEADRAISIRRLKGSVVSYLFSANPDEQGFEAVEDAMNELRHIQPGGAEFEELIAGIKEDPLRWKTIQLVKADAAKARAEVDVEWVEGMSARLNVHSGMRHLTMDLSNLTASGRGELETDTLTLDPDGQLRVDFDVPKPLVAFAGASRELHESLKLRGTGGLQPAADLEALGIDSRREDIEASVRVTLEQDLTLRVMGSWLAGILSAGLLLLAILAPKALVLMAKAIVLFPLNVIRGGPPASKSSMPEEGDAYLMGRLVCYAESGRVTGVDMGRTSRMAIKIEVDAMSEGDYEDAQFMMLARRDNGAVVYNLAVRDFGYFVNGVMVEPGTYAVEPGAMKIQGRSWSIVWEVG